MKEYGEIPGGNNEIKHLLYPFYKIYPLKIWSKYRWYKNSKLKSILPYLSQKQKWLTVIDRLGAPGDALITANVIRSIKDRYTGVRINCITPNPSLIKNDPIIETINQPETFYSFDSSYLELIARKEQNENIIQHNVNRLGIHDYEYRSIFYLSTKEEEWAKSILTNKSQKPILAICTRSKEPVKNWPLNYWADLVQNISSEFHIIQLGDSSEPKLHGVTYLAGKYTMRESAALLSKCGIFIGPDSLLMHIANGLNIQSIIIFGGSRPVKSFGYAKNINIASTPDCSPCWIHEGFEICDHRLQCMNSISTTQVLEAINSLVHLPSTN